MVFVLHECCFPCGKRIGIVVVGTGAIGTLLLLRLLRLRRLLGGLDGGGSGGVLGWLWHMLLLLVEALLARIPDCLEHPGADWYITLPKTGESLLLLDAHLASEGRLYEVRDIIVIEFVVLDVTAAGIPMS